MTWWEPSLSYDEAVDEVVSNACQTMLRDSEAAARLAAQDRTLAEKIRDFIRSMVQKLRDALSDVDPKDDLPIYRGLRALEGSLTQMQQLWDKALETAAANRQAELAVEGRKKAAPQGGVKHQAWGGKTAFVEDKYYARQIDRLSEIPDGRRVRVGEVIGGSPLHQVGIAATDVYFDVGKIRKELEKHGDHLTASVLKQIPALLADPVAITEYRGPNGDIRNTVNVYGDLFVDGKPITVGIMMIRGRNGIDLIDKVRTIHMRGDISHQITDDTILFLSPDKKRTRSWFQACGNSVPLRGAKYGPFRSIAYEDTKNKPKMQLWSQENVSDDSDAEARGRELARARIRSEQAVLAQTVKELSAVTKKQGVTIEHLRRQLRLTTPFAQESRQEDARKMARGLLREYGSQAQLSRTEKALRAQGMQSFSSIILWGSPLT